MTPKQRTVDCREAGLSWAKITGRTVLFRNQETQAHPSPPALLAGRPTAAVTSGSGATLDRNCLRHRGIAVLGSCRFRLLGRRSLEIAGPPGWLCRRGASPALGRGSTLEPSKFLTPPIRARRHQFQRLSRSFRAAFPKKMLGWRPPMAREPRIPKIRARQLSRNEPFSRKFGAEAHRALSPRQGWKGVSKISRVWAYNPKRTRSWIDASVRAGKNLDLRQAIICDREGAAFAMALSAEEIYRSSNGDRWTLIRDSDSGRLSVRHEANRSSGGSVTDTDVDVFLSIAGSGPEFTALRRLLNRPADSVLRSQ
jgi:hypothetical protein